MARLFPEIRPNEHFYLGAEPPHKIYVEESGNRTGLPVVFLHGGPGGGCEPIHRRFFDPQIYRIILLDQRGCGRSRPHAALESNHTQGLVEDLERVREKLGIDRWVLFGGSWGATLALLYAERFPQRVLGMILRGVFLGRRQDIRWFYQSGANRVFPDYWADFEALIPEPERADMVAAYYQRLTGNNEVARMSAAKAWAAWEGRCTTLHPGRNKQCFPGDPHSALALARIEAHYFMHDVFLEPNQVLRDAHRLAGIPASIVHGRYDMVCPVENALSLHRLWPASELEIIPGAGHAAGEPGIQEALIHAAGDMARRLTRGSSGT